MIFFTPEGEKCFGFIAAGETFFGDCDLAVGDYSDAVLVPVELVALDLHVQDCPVLG